MHIPNGFIPLWQCAIYLIILFIAVYFAQKWAKKNLDERTVPLMAVLAAGIFAIMTLNIPIPFGTSGHMVGAAMIAIIFGAVEPAILIFTLVLLVEALAMGDGGITVIGANLLNMGIIGSFVGLYGFKALKNPLGKFPAIAIASWLAIFLSACAAAVELWLAGTFPLGLGLFFMGGYHAIIGIIEATITVIVIAALENVRPDLLHWNKKDQSDELKSEPRASSTKNRNILIAGMIIALVVGISSPFLASSNPDGLQKTAQQLNANIKDTLNYNAPFPDYSLPIVGDSPLGGVIVIGIGVLVILGLAYILAMILKRRNPPETEP